MGSYAECWLGTFYVASTKNDVDFDLMRLFRTADKVVVPSGKQDVPFQMRRWIQFVDDEEKVDVVFYRASTQVIRDRLELHGYTLDVAREAFTRSLAGEAARYREWSSREHGEIFAPIASVLDSSNVDQWLDALGEIRRTGLKHRDVGGDLTAFEGTLTGHMLQHEWYGYSGPDLYVGLRLALEVCEEGDELIYDVTDLVLSGYVGLEDDLVEQTLLRSSFEYSSSGKIVVLTEGRTDTWILSESLRLLYPHLAEYFGFMDFEGARVGGGAGNLANLVKAFAGAGIVNRVVALFDNDTAAEAAIQGLRAMNVSENIRIQRLPDFAPLERYPTIGPSGSTVMNVNGMAASIELYLGIDVLTQENGDLVPVQWTGYESGLRKYQGEVLHKAAIQERFRARLEACHAAPDLLESTDWSGLRTVLSSLFGAFQKTDGENVCAAFNEYYSS